METDQSSIMFEMFTFLISTKRTQMEAWLYNMTTKTFISSNFVNVRGAMTINNAYFKNNTLIYMYAYDNSVGST